MVTQGFHIVVYGGRYFIDYHGSDAYPEHLGRNILGSLPTRPDQYKAWLSRQRDRYARFTARLEAQVLCVTDDTMYDLIDEEEEKEERGEGGEPNIEDTEEHPTFCHDEPPWRGIDYEWEQWEQMPSTIFDPGSSHWIEYTYMVDLDRELFRVNNWIQFHLWNIPRDRWIKAIGYDNGRETFDCKLCPEALWTRKLSTCFDDDAERDTCLKHYSEYHVTMATPTQTPLNIRKKYVGQILALAVFELFTDPTKAMIWTYLGDYDHRGFAFRELAFVFLSLAAGKVHYERLDHLCGETDSEKSNGYLVGLNKQGEPQLFSMLGSGSHLPDQEPGSSPTDTLFCLDGVVVGLVPDDTLQRDADAAVAKVVAYGLKLNKKVFSAILFSIYHAVMVDVDARNGKIQIRLGPKVRVLSTDFPQVSQVEHSHSGAESPMAALNRIYQTHSGFVALQDYFSEHARQRLPKCSQGIFPVELYSQILASADSDTLEACAQVSQQFYELCLAYAPFGDDITVRKFDLRQVRPSRYSKLINVRNLGLFTFLCHDTGDILCSGLDMSRHLLRRNQEHVETWCPVIGDPKRRTIVTNTKLKLLCHVA